MATSWTIGLLLALVSSVCWAAVDVARKRIGERMSAAVAVTGLMLAQVPFVLPFMTAAQFGVAPDSQGRVADLVFVEFPSLSGAYLAFAGASVALNIFANWLFLRAVQISPLSLTTPYLAFTPVFSAIVAFVWLGQQVTAWGVAGISTVCLGAFFLNPGSADEGLFAPLKALWDERGSLYMLVVALVWSVTPILDKRATDMTSEMWHTLFLAVGIGSALIVWQVARKKSAQTWREFGLMPLMLLFGGVLLVGAMVFQLASYAYIEIAYVETLKRAIGVTAAMIAGLLLFGERDIGRRFVAGAVMVAGVAMVLFGGY